MVRPLFQLLALQLIVCANVIGMFSGNKIPQATKYQVQQKIFTLGTSYSILDDKGKPAYKVNFKQLAAGKHLHITDVNGKQEYYSIKHILNPLGLAKYEIREGNQVIADVHRKVNLVGGKKFSVKSKHGKYNIEGNFNSREFKIKNNGRLVATVSKKFFTFGDKYGVKVEKGQDAPFILSLAIVVDEVAHG